MMTTKDLSQLLMTSRFVSGNGISQLISSISPIQVEEQLFRENDSYLRHALNARSSEVSRQSLRLPSISGQHHSDIWLYRRQVPTKAEEDLQGSPCCRICLRADLQSWHELSLLRRWARKGPHLGLEDHEALFKVQGKVWRERLVAKNFPRRTTKSSSVQHGCPRSHPNSSHAHGTGRSNFGIRFLSRYHFGTPLSNFTVSCQPWTCSLSELKGNNVVYSLIFLFLEIDGRGTGRKNETHRYK